jgi:hypothetical protein
LYALLELARGSRRFSCKGPFEAVQRNAGSPSMQIRTSVSAGLILAGTTIAPIAANAQTMMLAPLPPPRPFDLKLASAAPTLNPEAALRSSVAARDGVERRQPMAVAHRLDREVPMPRAVPSIMAPARP